MKNLVEMITILLGLFTLFFGILQYFWQKRFDEKLRVYKNYLAVVALSILSPEKQREIQLQQKHLLSKQELVLFAPEEIVELAGKIEPINFTKNNEQKHLEYLKLINLMRLDLQRFNKRISEESLRKLLG
ncbi:hypothetical protein [Streptococcus anginosus]|uniref:Uncharacterized protein n=1 Tax=Streptococcus anginosus subsp. whileyi CCUG 39159 TaxID=1095729 RepID=I0SDG5_STRAP|nr:hypothetical protein [Streptococcus anginosus]EID21418.1 hypothetical protein HMPREF1043_0510 [Streptococcus anginosus subsp. whileyi CCUG 39159]MDB8661268.1 hypothetical protein [Streptococcus anginosus]MDP1385148.1 hypothetical protein [Streptococcus anginosus]QQT09201.1 hypothetical protein I6J12_01060 [Streptococcus anginosus]BAN62257.1 hypothetical protein ANG_1787 [Streptococcus anginosus subsp. whileyi MAS624]